MFSLHLLAQLTEVIKAIWSPVQKEQSIPRLHHLYNHGDANRLHHISTEMLNSAGPCIPPKERPPETEPLTTPLHMMVQPVFPPACSPPTQSVSPQVSYKDATEDYSPAGMEVVQIATESPDCN